jgi:hypothetical protein
MIIAEPTATLATERTTEETYQMYSVIDARFMTRSDMKQRTAPDVTTLGASSASKKILELGNLGSTRLHAELRDVMSVAKEDTGS